MSFTSLNFLVFLLAVIVINYCLSRNTRWIFLLAASYYFYLNWQPIYAVLLLLTTVSTYICSLLMTGTGRVQKYKKTICTIGCIFPLAILGLFKYHNFVTTSISNALSSLNLHVDFPQLNLLMPIGISFYTFTAVGYLIDIYRNKYKPERNFFILSLFIGFFAQIASGPIPRGQQLIPQLRKPDNLGYDNVIGGLRSLLWGYFMKLCVANRVAIYVDAIYGNMNHHNGTTLLLASVLYSIQIYCDFAGYSLIAIGAARMLGINLIENFKRPYFATSIKDFWSRWHISLSTWFRDYVYIPLGGNRVSRSRNVFNLIVTFLISGLWHGSAWNFILWGGMHGVGQSVEKLTGNRKRKRAVSGMYPLLVQVIIVFVIINFLWVFFRLETVNDITTFFSKVLTEFGTPFIHISLASGGLSIIILLMKDFIDEFYPSLTLLNSHNIIVSNLATGFLLALIFLLGVFDSTSFIYFQF